MAVGGVGAGPPGVERILPREADAARPVRPFELGTGEAGAEGRGQPPGAAGFEESRGEGARGTRDRQQAEPGADAAVAGMPGPRGPMRRNPDPTGRGRLIDIRI